MTSVATQGTAAKVTPRKPVPVLPYHWREKNPQAEVHYIRDIDQVNQQISRLGRGPVGFDLEWKPNFVKGLASNRVALVQLANNNLLLLIQVSAMPKFPIELQIFLEDAGIIKAGVAIKDDAMKMHHDWQVSIRNCVDLSLLAKSVDNNQWKGKYSNPIGLSRLVEAYEDRALSKGRTARSNWEALLNERQIEYASNDAHAGFVIYEKLIALARAMSTVPASICYTFDCMEGQFRDPSGNYWHAQNPDYDPGPPPPRPPAAVHATIQPLALPGRSMQGFPSLAEPTIHGHNFKRTYTRLPSSSPAHLTQGHPVSRRQPSHLNAAPILDSNVPPKQSIWRLDTRSKPADGSSSKSAWGRGPVPRAAKKRKAPSREPNTGG